MRHRHFPGIKGVAGVGLLIVARASLVAAPLCPIIHALRQTERALLWLRARVHLKEAAVSDGR